MSAKTVVDYMQLQPERLGHAVCWSIKAQRVFRPQWLAMWGDGFVQELNVLGENHMLGEIPVEQFGTEMPIETLDDLLRLAQHEPSKREAVAYRVWESNKSTSRQPTLLIPSVTPADVIKVQTTGHVQRVLVLGQSLA